MGETSPVISISLAVIVMGLLLYAQIIERFFCQPERVAVGRSTFFRDTRHWPTLLVLLSGLGILLFSYGAGIYIPLWSAEAMLQVLAVSCVLGFAQQATIRALQLWTLTRGVS